MGLEAPIARYLRDLGVIGLEAVEDATSILIDVTVCLAGVAESHPMTWDDFCSGIFSVVRDVMRAAPGVTTVVMMVDSYDHVPVFKEPTQAKRRQRCHEDVTEEVAAAVNVGEGTIPMPWKAYYKYRSFRVKIAEYVGNYLLQLWRCNSEIHTDPLTVILDGFWTSVPNIILQLNAKPLASHQNERVQKILAAASRCHSLGDILVSEESIGVAETGLETPLGEVDIKTPFWLNILTDERPLVLTNDSDMFITCLLYLYKYQMKQDILVGFYTRTGIRDNQLYSIDRLLNSIINHFNVFAVNDSDCISDICALLVMAGNDYVDRIPRIGSQVYADFILDQRNHARLQAAGKLFDNEGVWPVINLAVYQRIQKMILEFKWAKSPKVPYGLNVCKRSWEALGELRDAPYGASAPSGVRISLMGRRLYWYMCYSARGYQAESAEVLPTNWEHPIAQRLDNAIGWKPPANTDGSTEIAGDAELQMLFDNEFTYEDE